MGAAYGFPSFIEVSFKHHTENEIQFQEAEELFFIFTSTLSIQHLPFITVKFKYVIALKEFNALNVIIFIFSSQKKTGCSRVEVYMKDFPKMR